MRLVRELLAADVEPALADAATASRAARYVEVVTAGLGLRGAVLLLRDPSGDGLVVGAGTLPAHAAASLVDPSGRGAALARRALAERRAFLARRAADDPLVRMLHDADPAIETVAILPLADRAPVGVMVLAGDETTLAADVVRTLNPAVRLLALLVSPHREGGVARDPEAERRLEGLRAERDAGVLVIRTLEARVAELERALATASAASAGPATAAPTEDAADAAPPPPARAPEPAPATAPPPGPIVVADTELEWSRFPIRDRQVVVTEPTGAGVEHTAELGPERIVVNLAAPGGLAHAIALRAHGVVAPLFGVVAHAGGERVVGLGPVEGVAHSPSAEALAAAVERAAPRGARVFAAGRDAELLMKMRQMLAKHGLSVSLARDTKQIDELLAMVRPQVVVIDLMLPMRQGYELVFRMAATAPVPAMVLIAPDGDPGPVLVDRLRDRVSGGMGAGAKQWLADLVQQKLPSKRVARPRPSAA